MGPLRHRRRYYRRTVGLCLGAGLELLLGCATPHHPPAVTNGGPKGLVVDCAGPRSASPTVWLEAGAFGDSADWGRVRRSLSKYGRVCSYDRRGLGKSPNRTGEPTPEAIARDFRDLLDREGQRDPIILVGHSDGAFYAEAFAILYPERVAGLLFVDGVGTDDLDEPLVTADLRRDQVRAALAVVGGELGLARLAAGPMIDAIGLKGASAHAKWLSLISARHRETARAEVLQILPSLPRIREHGALPSRIPVAVIVASQNPDADLDKAWRRAQVAPALRACHRWVLDAVGATHVSPLGRDRSYVVAAVRWLARPGLVDEPCTVASAPAPN